MLKRSPQVLIKLIIENIDQKQQSDKVKCNFGLIRCWRRVPCPSMHCCSMYSSRTRQHLKYFINFKI